MADGEAAYGEKPLHGLGKFIDPDRTLAGAQRAQVALARFETLWVNTGTQCNIECVHCYIESSPTNDRLTYLNTSEIAPFLDEAAQLGAREIGFTGGEPFLNPAMNAMAEAALMRGFDVLILTNAMRPMMRPRVKDGLLELHRRFGSRIKLRVSVDHFEAAQHDHERGAGSFDAALTGIAWLLKEGFEISIAGRDLWREGEAAMRAGFAEFFAANDIPLDSHNPAALILFPEMDETVDVPEITTECWSLLGKDPQAVMCASSRMLVKRKALTRRRSSPVRSCLMINVLKWADRCARRRAL